jgi:hypothetical protein
MAFSNFDDIRRALTRKKKLGKGGQGDVFSCEMEGEQVAIKVICRNLGSVLTEVSSIQSLREHPNIIIIKGWVSSRSCLSFASSQTHSHSCRQVAMSAELTRLTSFMS